jgi:hypothetical protein
MSNSIYLCQPTVIDHAIINSNGCIVGGSCNPDFIISGKVDPVEQVVVDFSKIKKEVKAAVDDKFVGFDHKLWVVEHYSDCKIFLTINAQEVEVSFDEYNFKLPFDTRVTIKTPYLEMELPLDAIRFMPNPTQRNLANVEEAHEFIATSIEYHVLNTLTELHPHNSIEVECQYKCLPHIMGGTEEKGGLAVFKYTHPLPFSSSYGCQNIGHGHLSYIEVLGSDGCNEEALLTEIEDLADRIDNYVFVNRNYVTKVTTEHGTVLDYSYCLHALPENCWVTVEYETPQRGYFRATYKICDKGHKLYFLDQDTTIENMLDWVLVGGLERVLKDHGATAFYMSEGLSKGAMRYLK